MHARGKFAVTSKAEPPFFSEAGTTLGRMSFDKVFEGALTAKGHVQMTYARPAEQTSGAYVAIERIDGTLDGKRGSFCTAHLGLSERGKQTLTLVIVPDSGTGELTGLRGTMKIDIVDGQHFYEVDFAFST